MSATAGASQIAGHSAAGAHPSLASQKSAALIRPVSCHGGPRERQATFLSPAAAACQRQLCARITGGRLAGEIPGLLKRAEARYWPHG
jgi:hypothetical protein